jgi:hypothetical protein
MNIIERMESRKADRISAQNRSAFIELLTKKDLNITDLNVRKYKELDY